MLHVNGKKKKQQKQMNKTNIAAMILLVIRWAGVWYQLYLVEELIHGKAAGQTMYDVSETRYNPYPTTQRT